VLKTFINGPSNQFMNLYRQYSMNYIHSLTALSTLKQGDENFSFWLHHFEEDDRKQSRSSSRAAVGGDDEIQYISNVKKELPLESLLIAPVQRVPRYRLLLKEMLKHTTPAHVDYEPIQQALDVVEYLCDSINHSLVDTSGDTSGGGADDQTQKDIAIHTENPRSVIVKALTSSNAPLGPPPPASDLNMT
jgi:hypothetical protein